jgi:hypothetical protein
MLQDAARPEQMGPRFRGLAELQAITREIGEAERCGARGLRLGILPRFERPRSLALRAPCVVARGERRAEPRQCHRARERARSGRFENRERAPIVRDRLVALALFDQERPDPPQRFGGGQIGGAFSSARLVQRRLEIRACLLVIPRLPRGLARNERVAGRFRIRGERMGPKRRQAREGEEDGQAATASSHKTSDGSTARGPGVQASKGLN